MLGLIVYAHTVMCVCVWGGVNIYLYVFLTLCFNPTMMKEVQIVLSQLDNKQCIPLKYFTNKFQISIYLH